MRLAVLSYHTSPLAQPGAGDGGGMNVYVRQLSSALARAGLDCDVYTRAWRRGLPPVVAVEAGFRVHHVVAGPTVSVTRHVMPELVGQFTEGVLRRIRDQQQNGCGPDLIHANYWLSGVAGHALKHELELPLVSTFHTLARVKAEANPEEHDRRTRAEAEVIGCSDAILASASHERAQLEGLYSAVPGRVETVPPGVDHELFSPGDRQSARAALGLAAGPSGPSERERQGPSGPSERERQGPSGPSEREKEGPVLLFVGRLQPLKGAAVAIETLALLADGHGGRPGTLLIVGGPSGPDGGAELGRLRALVAARGLERVVRFVPPQPHEHLATYYRAADVCLVPSHSESFGLVALEAAACGTPVIAASVGGLLTLVDHARTGFLVEGRDASAYATYARLLLDNPHLAMEMGVAAARDARRYSWSITAARLRRLYADLSERRLVECS